MGEKVEIAGNDLNVLNGTDNVSNIMVGVADDPNIMKTNVITPKMKQRNNSSSSENMYRNVSAANNTQNNQSDAVNDDEDLYDNADKLNDNGTTTTKDTEQSIPKKKRNLKDYHSEGEINKIEHKTTTTAHEGDI